MKKLLLICVAIGGGSRIAFSQENTYYITVSNVVSPEQPSAEIEVWAAFDPLAFAQAQTDFDFVSEPDSGGFTNPQLIVKGPGSYPGDLADDGDSVIGVHVFQYCEPIGGIFPDLSNPILLWGVTWSTDDFSPRLVDLMTLTSEYMLYPSQDCVPESYLDNDFAEGFAQITVVPAPAGAGVLAATVGLLAGRRRRRGT